MQKLVWKKYQATDEPPILSSKQHTSDLLYDSLI